MGMARGIAFGHDDKDVEFVAAGDGKEVAPFTGGDLESQMDRAVLWLRLHGLPNTVERPATLAAPDLARAVREFLA